MSKRTSFKTYQFALVIVRNFDGRWLAVNESRGRGWWVPGGGVDYGETFEQAAHRETKEEAGVEIKLKGVLRVEHSPVGDQVRMRVIFYAEPKDDKQVPKQVPDEESNGACWLTFEELVKLDDQNPGIRGEELIHWPLYIERGGNIAPMEVFAREEQGVPRQQTRFFSFPKLREWAAPKKEEPQEEGKMEEVKAGLQSPASKQFQLLETIEAHLQDETIKLLIPLSPEQVNERISDKKLTYLLIAIRANCPIGIIRSLLIAGADPSLTTTGHRSGLHFAARENRADIVSALLMSLELLGKAGEIKKLLLLKDQEEGKSPLDYVKDNLGGQRKDEADKIMKEFARYLA